MYLSALCFSQVSPCLHQHCPQHNWGKSWSPLCSQGWACSWNTTSCKRALERSCTGASSGKISFSWPRVWRSQHFSLSHHQISLSFEERLIPYPFWLYSRLRWRLLTFTQPLPNHCSYPLIGQSTALIHPHHPGLSSPGRETPRTTPPHLTHQHKTYYQASDSSREQTYKGGWIRPPPGSSSTKAVWWYGVFFWKDLKGRERNQSRRKLQERRGLTSSINARSAGRKTICNSTPVISKKHLCPWASLKSPQK